MIQCIDYSTQFLGVHGQARCAHFVVEIAAFVRVLVQYRTNMRTANPESLENASIPPLTLSPC